ncbi:MAG: alpha/beta fold hydrolase [Acidimicrobiales bacterium]
MPDLAAVDGEGISEDRVELVHGYGLRVVSRGWGDPFVWAHDAFFSIDDDDLHSLVDFDRLATGSRLIRYDAVGHGRSPGVAHPGDHTWDSRADDLLQLCERVRLPIVSLGGFSTGAATALWAAHMAPERVDRLVLAALPNGWTWRAPAAGIQGLLGASALTGLTEPMRFLARYLPLPGGEPRSVAAYRSAHFRKIVSTPRQRYVAALVGAARSNLPSPDDLARLTMPTLILAYPGDPLRPIGTAVRVARALPNAELVIADHQAQVADWTDLIRDFVGGRGGRTLLS